MRNQIWQTILSVINTIITALTGRKVVGVGNIGRATTAARGAGRVMKEQEDVTRASETVEAIQGAKDKLAAELQAEIDTITNDTDVSGATLTKVSLRPKKTGISPQLVALVWLPQWSSAAGTTPAWQ